MTPVKRIEIVLDAAHTPALLKVLRTTGAKGYTLVRDVHGAGDRGERTGDHLTEVFRNCLVLVACPSDQSDELLKSIRPLLEEYGGMCLVSDAHWLRH